MKPYTYKELRDLSDDDLIATHDNIAKGHIEIGLNYFLEEIQRREQSKQTEIMVKYTKQLWILTIVVTVATVLNLIVVLIR